MCLLVCACTSSAMTSEVIIYVYTAAACTSGCCMYRKTVCKKSPCTRLCWPQLFIILLYLLVYLLGYLLLNLFIILPWAVKRSDHALKMRLLQMYSHLRLVYVLHKVGVLSWRRLTIGEYSLLWCSDFSQWNWVFAHSGSDGCHYGTLGLLYQFILMQAIVAPPVLRSEGSASSRAKTSLCDQSLLFCSTVRFHGQMVQPSV